MPKNPKFFLPLVSLNSQPLNQVQLKPDFPIFTSQTLYYFPLDFWKLLIIQTTLLFPGVQKIGDSTVLFFPGHIEKKIVTQCLLRSKGMIHKQYQKLIINQGMG